MYRDRLVSVLVTIGPQAQQRPKWLRAPAPVGQNYRELKQLIADLNLHTVCESAACPNVGECWNRRTATFMILGQRLHAPLRLLRGAKRRTAASRLRRTAPRRRSHRRHGTALRRDHQRQSRRPQGRRRRALQADHRSHSRAHSGLQSGSPGAGFSGQPRGHGNRDERAARRAQSQHRNGAAALPAGAAGRALRTLARHASARQSAAPRRRR